MAPANVVSHCPVCRGELYTSSLYPDLEVCRTCGREFPRSQVRAHSSTDNEPAGDIAAVELPADPRADANVEKKPRTYKPKVCRCGDTFTPTGPRDIRCVPCKARF
jgi:acetyl-CoA carboxylase beta subunit